MILYLLQLEKQQQNEHEYVQVPGRVQLAKELECNRSALTREISHMQKDEILTIKGHFMKLNKDKIK